MNTDDNKKPEGGSVTISGSVTSTEGGNAFLRGGNGEAESDFASKAIEPGLKLGPSEPGSSLAGALFARPDGSLVFRSGDKETTLAPPTNTKPTSGNVTISGSADASASIYIDQASGTIHLRGNVIIEGQESQPGFKSMLLKVEEKHHRAFRSKATALGLTNSEFLSKLIELEAQHPIEG